MHAITPLISFSLIWLASARPFLPDRIEAAATAVHCDAKDPCSGVPSRHTANPYICGDNRLGPKELQNKEILTNNVLGPMLTKYNPFPGSCPGVFLGIWGTDNGLRYPQKNGFQLDSNGEPIIKNITLAPGTVIDRFGTDRGYFVAPYGTPYEQRSLPPMNLATNPKYSDGTPYNFHVYEVIKDLPVRAGPIAPWFGQPGNGTQYVLNMRVQEAIKDGFLIETCNPGMYGCGTAPDTNIPTRIVCNKSGRWETAGECGNNQFCRLYPTNQMPSCQPKSVMAKWTSPRGFQLSRRE
ncbi:hypothetical protein J3459_016789 [Metarhizium acridum]|nr:hypothetical protein J3459_016789 [Metarhizium acridum]